MREISKEEIRSAFKPILKLAIEEDLGFGDITTEAVISLDEVVTVHLYAKSAGVLCGLDLFEDVLSLDGGLRKMKFFANEGQFVPAKTLVLEMEILQNSILRYERIALNILQRLSGIATKARQFVDALEGTSVKILDTRKTLPGYRLLEKYAVRTGGATNHRFGLYDMFLIKDNHLSIAGGVKQAVSKVREYQKKNPRVQHLPVEVECKDLSEVQDAVDMGVDIIMLDNMTESLLKKAIDMIPSPIKKEISGNITFGRLGYLSRMNIDYLSCGAITHSVEAVDFSIRVLEK